MNKLRTLLCPLLVVLGFATQIGALDVEKAAGEPESAADTAIVLSFGYAAPTFVLARQYATSAYARNMTAADLNGDGNLDLVAGQAYNRMAILVGRGDGAFDEPRDIPVGAEPRHDDPYIMPVVADFDLDGDKDIAAVTGFKSRVVVFSNDGSAVFSDSAAYGIGSRLSGAAAGDVDGDGREDILLADGAKGGHRFWLMIGKGDGSFQEPVKYATGGSPSWIVAEDFNNDSLVDVVTVNMKPRTIALMENDGHGGFQSASEYPYTGVTGTDDRAACVGGDLNSDGYTDVAVVNFYTDTLFVFVNDGGGGFLPVSRYPGVFGALDMCTGDLDGDGDLDLLVTANDMGKRVGTVAIYQNDGSGHFDVVLASPSLDGVATSVIAADFDNDLDLDIAVSYLRSRGQSAISVFLNQGVE